MIKSAQFLNFIKHHNGTQYNDFKKFKYMMHKTGEKYVSTTHILQSNDALVIIHSSSISTNDEESIRKYAGVTSKFIFVKRNIDDTDERLKQTTWHGLGKYKWKLLDISIIKDDGITCTLKMHDITDSFLGNTITYLFQNKDIALIERDNPVIVSVDEDYFSDDQIKYFIKSHKSFVKRLMINLRSEDKVLWTED